MPPKQSTAANLGSASCARGSSAAHEAELSFCLQQWKKLTKKIRQIQELQKCPNLDAAQKEKLSQLPGLTIELQNMKKKFPTEVEKAEADAQVTEARVVAEEKAAAEAKADAEAKRVAKARDAAEAKAVADAVAAAKARAAAHAKKVSETYFYVLPNTYSKEWHEVHQQRLDNDPHAADCIKAAIEEGIEKAGFGKPSAGDVEVATAHVDLFNDAYTFGPDHSNICRPKVYEGVVDKQHRWRPENKRFLVRVNTPRFAEFFCRLRTIFVKNVKQLPAATLQSYFFQSYEKHHKKLEHNTAGSANVGDIQLSLCSPFVFAVQGSLSPTYLPSAASFDLNTLGTAFLDIIMVILRALYKLFVLKHTYMRCAFVRALLSSNSFSALAAREISGAQKPHGPFFCQFGAVSDAELFCAFPRSQRRPPSIRHQYCGAVQLAAMSLHRVDFFSQEKALQNATHEYFYKGTGMELAVRRFKDEPPAKDPAKGFRNSFNFPFYKQRFFTTKSKNDASVFVAGASAEQLPMQGQEPFDILE
jgi:hypothetical protein